MTRCGRGVTLMIVTWTLRQNLLNVNVPQNIPSGKIIVTNGSVKSFLGIITLLDTISERNDTTAVNVNIQSKAIGLEIFVFLRRIKVITIYSYFNFIFIVLDIICIRMLRVCSWIIFTYNRIKRFG